MSSEDAGRLIEELFKHMDQWRHFPSYQLERRADILFSLYLKEVLEAKFNIPLHPVILPEFPVRYIDISDHLDSMLEVWLKESAQVHSKKSSNELRKSIESKIQTKGNHSFRVDYLALSEDLETAIFVELKTDCGSRNDVQDFCLAAVEKLINENSAQHSPLLRGVIEIFENNAGDAKRKYFRLLEQLKKLNLITEIPSELRSSMGKKNLKGTSGWGGKITVCDNKPLKACVVYIQPSADFGKASRLEPQDNPQNIITFDLFNETVSKYSDPLSRRFSRSLLEWGSTKAGYIEPKT